VRLGVANRPDAAARAAATSLWLFYVLGAAGTLVLRAEAHAAVWQGFIVPFTMFAAVGWAVAVRRPRAPLGWLFLGIAFLTTVGILGDAVVSLAVHRGWGCHGIVMFAAWTQLWFWYPLVVLATGHTMLLFPNGLPSRRWRPVLMVLTASVAVITVMAALSPDVQFGQRMLSNPIGIHSSVKDIEKTTVFSGLTVVMMACIVASIASLGLRFRRSRGVERAQLKWFLLGAAAVGTVFAATLVPAFNNSAADDVLFPVALTLLPLSCGLAVLRYRLYDIDRIVSRTVSYGVVTGTIVAVYVGVVALVEDLLGFSSGVAVAASTLIAAAAFQPLRRRVQRRVDRRFDRAAYDARRTVDGFSGRLRDEVDVDAVRTDLLATVSSAVAPTAASLWLVHG
jgi:hypothetical protein